MNKRLSEMAEKLTALRQEIDELQAIEDPTDEQAARMDQIIPEWDEVKAEHDRLAEREAKIEAIRTASISEGNRERSAPAVHVRTDPFENIERVQFMSNSQVRDAALSAFEGTKHRGLRDSELEALVERIESVPGVARHALIHGSAAYRSAFTAWLNSQGQNVVYTAEEAAAVRAALSLSSSAGGYTLPTLLDPTLIKTGTASKNPVRRLSRVVEGTVNVWNGVSVNNVTSYWTAEANALTDGNPTFVGPSITAHKMTAYLPGSFEIWEDSNLQAQMPGLIAESFEYLESDAFVTGSGSGAPYGVVTAVAAVTASRISPTTGGTFTTASAADVFKLVNGIPSRYEDSSTWLANKAIFNLIKQMSTGSQGSYFWTDFNNEVGEGQGLLGSPVAKSSAMTSTVTTGSNLIVLGDFSQFVIYDRIGTVLDFDPIVVNTSGLPTGQRALIAHKRVGANVTDANAFRVLQL